MEVHEDVIEKFKEFFWCFTDRDGNPKYQEAINRMVMLRSRSLVVDFEDLMVYAPDLASGIIDSPKSYLQCAETALLQVLAEHRKHYLNQMPEARLHVRLRKVENHVQIRQLGSSHIGKMVSIRGVVVRASKVKQYIREGAYECPFCGFNTLSPEPLVTCPKCDRKLRLNLEKSMFDDIQTLVVQEETEVLSSGELPRSVEVVATDDLADVAKPGDVVEISGVVRIRKDKAYYTTYLEANNIEVLNKLDEEVTITPEEEEKIREVARDPNLMEKLVASIAPSIYGMEEVKEAILYALVGGVPKRMPDGVRLRGDIHVLLIGDPGTAKSQLLRHVVTLAPRGIYTTGKGTTAAGLTATVVRDKETGDYYLEAGALVLADGGICAIDEIDKMRNEDRVAMHEAMEQQTISIAKAGIVATLNARTSIIAAANPALGRYVSSRPLNENINLPPAILSRFDLIFILQDRPGSQRDANLSTHILAMHASGAVPTVFNPRFLKKYIAYARNVRPRLTEEAIERIKDYYLKLREKATEESPIPISPRQLESLVRLAEARAKLFLRDRVTVEDAEAAIRLMDYCLRTVAKDEMGRIDIDVIVSDKPRTQREKILKILEIVDKLQKEVNGPVHKDLIAEEAQKYGLDKDFVEEMLEKLHLKGLLVEWRTGYYKKI